jgi:hypothetical protein
VIFTERADTRLNNEERRMKVAGGTAGLFPFVSWRSQGRCGLFPLFLHVVERKRGEESQTVLSSNCGSGISAKEHGDSSRVPAMSGWGQGALLDITLKVLER